MDGDGSDVGCGLCWDGFGAGGDAAELSFSSSLSGIVSSVYSLGSGGADGAITGWLGRYSSFRSRKMVSSKVTSVEMTNL